MGYRDFMLDYTPNIVWYRSTTLRSVYVSMMTKQTELIALVQEVQRTLNNIQLVRDSRDEKIKQSVKLRKALERIEQQGRYV
jgi:hypothetical protein